MLLISVMFELMTEIPAPLKKIRKKSSKFTKPLVATFRKNLFSCKYIKLVIYPKQNIAPPVDSLPWESLPSSVLTMLFWNVL